MISCSKKIAKMKQSICKLWVKEKFNFLGHHKKKTDYPTGLAWIGIHTLIIKLTNTSNLASSNALLSP